MSEIEKRPPAAAPPAAPAAAPAAEETINGVPHRLFDGYDGSESAPPDGYIAKLMASAPPEVKARAQEWAKQRQAAGGDAAAAGSEKPLDSGA